MSSKRRASQQEQQDERSSEEPCSSSSIPAQAQKRPRYSSDSAEQVQHSAAARGTLLQQCSASIGLTPAQAPRFRHTQQVIRPGIPNPIRLSDFKLADKPSPPLRADDKVWQGGALHTVHISSYSI